MRKNATWFLTLIVILICPISAQSGNDPTDLDLDGLPGVAAPPDGDVPENPPVLVGAGTLLIDHSHHGSAVLAFDVSGLTNDLASQGWVISVLSAGPVTEEVLAGADVFLVPTRAAGFGSIFPFTSAEVTAVRSFLSDGKGLWVLSDLLDPSGVNTLSTAFGVTFAYDSVRDPSNNEGQLYWPTIHTLAEHPVNEGVESYGYYLGACLLVQTPSVVVARGDDDAYSFYCPVGSFPPTLVVCENGGRVLFAGDITPLHPNYYLPRLRPEEQLLLQNIANWLLGTQPTPTSSISWGAVKAKYTEERR